MGCGREWQTPPEKDAKKFPFIPPPVPGHLNPMTTLARKLRLRNHDVLFIGLPDSEPSVRAAGLNVSPLCRKRVPSRFARRTSASEEQARGRRSAPGCTTECCRQDRSDVECIACDAHCSRGRCSRTRHRSGLRRVSSDEPWYPVCPCRKRAALRLLRLYSVMLL